MVLEVPVTGEEWTNDGDWPGFTLYGAFHDVAITSAQRMERGQHGHLQRGDRKTRGQKHYSSF